MILVRVAFALLAPALAGWALLGLLWPAQGGWALRLMRANLALVLGLGVTACLYFLWLVLAGAPSTAFILAELALTCGLAGITWRTRRNRLPSVEQPQRELGSASPLLLGVAGLVALVAAGSLLISARGSPHGAYDAWAIWNTHARFLARGGEHWRDLFLPGSSAHPDYPMLIPGAVARGWLYTGGEATLVPIAISLLFVAGTAGILLGALALLRGAATAALGLAFLLGASHYVYNGAAQMADVPLGALMLAALALVALHPPGRARAAGPLALAGLAAGLAGWTKNEGLLFLVALGLALALSELWAGRRGDLPRRAGALLLGLLPPLLLVAYFKLALAPANDLVAGQSGGTLARLSDPARVVQVARAYLAWFATFGRGALPALLVMVLAYYSRWNLRASDLRVPGLVLALMLAGYFVVFLTSPHNLTWHLAAFERLLVQLWPSLLLAVGLLVRSTRMIPLANPHSEDLGATGSTKTLP